MFPTNKGGECLLKKNKWDVCHLSILTSIGKASAISPSLIDLWHYINFFDWKKTKFRCGEKRGR